MEAWELAVASAVLLASGSTAAAAGTNIAVSAIAALSGGLTHARAGRVSWRIVAWMTPPSVVGAFLGVLALGLLTNGMNLLGVHTYYQIAIRAMILIAVVAIDAFTTNLMRRRLTAAGAARAGTGA